MRVTEQLKRQATRLGIVGGACSTILWPVYAHFQEPLRVPFALALMATALAGASILLIVLSDLLTVRRQHHGRRARMFDLALGLLLAVPSTLALVDLL